MLLIYIFVFFFSSRRRHTRWNCDWSSDVCSSDLMRFFRPIMDFSEKYNILQSAMAASERIFKLLDTPVDIVSAAVTKKPEGPGRIEFDHAWFAYRDVPAEGDASVGTGTLARLAEQSSAGSLPGNG